MKKTDDFISLYKELEEELRKDQNIVMAYEAALPPDDYDRLKITRQIRNYIQHHSDDFICISQDMCDFVKRIIEQVKREREKVKDRLKRLKPLSPNDKIEEIYKWMDKNKTDFAPIVDNNNYLGCITYPLLIHSLTLLSSKKKIKEIGKYVKITQTSSDTDLDSLKFGESIIVVDDEKYKGVVKW